MSFFETQERNRDEGHTTERTADQRIIASLKQSEAGMTTSESFRQEGITEETYDRWQAKGVGTNSSEGKRPKQLEDENRKQKPERPS